MAECIAAIERSVCEIAQSLSYLAKYCYNIAEIYNINHYIFNYYIYIYFTYLGFRRWVGPGTLFDTGHGPEVFHFFTSLRGSGHAPVLPRTIYPELEIKS